MRGWGLSQIQGEWAHPTNRPPSSSSIWIRMISSNDRSAANPNSRARRASKRGGQPDADAVEKAAPAVIGEQEFADRLLRAVAGQRRGQKLVADGIRERRAEHGEGRGEDEAGRVTITDPAHGLEQVARAVEVDA